MGAYNLYIDTDRNKAVVGVDDSSIASLPPFVQEDSLQLRVWLLTGFSSLVSYSKVPVAGITLEVAIGTRIGNSSTYYTQQFTWTPSEDLGQPYFAGTLSMSTAAITTLLGTAGSASAYLQIRKTENAVPATILQEPITVFASVIKDGVTEVPAPLTPLSAEAANASYVRVIHTGSFDLMNSNGLGIRIYCDTDGSFRTDPIS